MRRDRRPREATVGGRREGARSATEEAGATPLGGAATTPAADGSPAGDEHGAETGALDSLRRSRERREHERRRRRERQRRRRVVAAVGIAAVVAVPLGVARLTAPSLDVSGPAAGAVLGRDALARTRFAAAAGTPAADDARWTLDGRPVTPRREGSSVVVPAAGLRDGNHRLEVEHDGGLLRGTQRREFSFRVDTTPPAVRLARPAAGVAGRPLSVSGTAPGVTRLLADGRAVAVPADGRFSLRFDTPPTRPVVLAATDAAGNTARWRMPVTVVPRRPGAPMRAVHVTAIAWADRTLRGAILDLLEEGRINTIELDVKDESGVLGWNAAVPLARRMGATQPVFDLPAAVRDLHRRGARVVARLVCFRDPIHAAAAWRGGRRAEVIQDRAGSPYAAYGGFTNPANPAVRRYNIDVAVAAARAGVDDILYDYVRRPDGPPSSMVFPGLQGPPERAIVAFLAESRRALQPHGTFVGASVFGVAATRPTEVAQDIPAMAREVDYIAPMVYPSHWGPGEYDVRDPNGQPYEIVRRSLADFVEQVRGTGARVVPWLQDFSLGREYGPAEVRAQIRGARDAGLDEFILWDAGVTYTAAGLTTDAPKGATGTAPARAPAGARALIPIADPKPPAAPRPIPAGVKPNELGQVPVLMHHEIRRDRVGPYDQTPAEFRAELERLWRSGYVPIRASDLVTGRIDVPAGKTPVVMTFDDATRFQFAYRGNRVDPDTAMGVMLDFARTHRGFRPAGTFYVLREPFGGIARGPEMLRWLARNGFELGNHTHDHTPLNTLDDRGVQRQLAMGAEVIERAVPGYRIRTMALPLGAMPRRPALAVRGSWGGRSYGPYGVFLVGANPAPSPFSTAFDRAAIPRIRSSHAGWRGERDYGAAYWLRELDRHPERRYVSDGDPDRVAFPRAERAGLAPAFAARARPL